MLRKVKAWLRDKFIYRAKRSPHWPKVRTQHLVNEAFCQWCGGMNDLEVHHIQPFHLHPEKELDDSNLITLCEAKLNMCHLHHGHLGNWKESNPQIKEQCNKNKSNRGKFWHG